MTDERKSRTGELVCGGAGLLLLTAALVRFPLAWALPAGLIALLIAAITPLSIRLNDPIRLPAAAPIELLLMLVAPPPVSILAAGFVGLVTSLWYRRPAVRTLFNVANLAIPNALGVAALVLLARPWPRPLAIPGDLPVIVLAIFLRMSGNLLGQSLLWNLQGKERLWPFFWASWKEEVRTRGVGIRLLPVLMAIAFPAAGWWVLLLGAGVQVSLGASLRRYQERIDRQTLTDGLTNLANRKAWEQFRQGEGAGRPAMIALLDMDGLKAVNDLLGHDQGDQVLVDLARRLQAAAPAGRTFRIGGDEFLVIMPAAGDLPAFREAMLGAVAEFSRRWEGQAGLHVSASVGFAHCPTEQPDLASAIALADQRMYAAKAGRPGRAAAGGH